MNKWTKKLDSIHYTKEGRTLCGRPCLGNNYMLNDTYKAIDKEIRKERTMCKECEEANNE